jgi:hypothetical protein
MRVLAAIWALPTAIVGVALALLGWPLAWWQPEVANGAIFLRAKGPLGWAFRMMGWGAVTFAWICLSWEPISDRLVRHESTHTAQCFKLGPFFLPVWLYFTVTRGYRENPLEIAAYKAGDGDA